MSDARGGRGREGGAEGGGEGGRGVEEGEGEEGRGGEVEFQGGGVVNKGYDSITPV